MTKPRVKTGEEWTARRLALRAAASILHIHLNRARHFDSSLAIFGLAGYNNFNSF